MSWHPGDGSEISAKRGQCYVMWQETNWGIAGEYGKNFKDKWAGCERLQ